MTFWAKFLAGLVLVLSIVFAAMSAVLFAKRDRFREAYDVAMAELQQTRDAKTQMEQQLTRERDTYRKNYEDTANELKRVEGNLKNTETQLQAAQNRNQTLNETVLQLNGLIAYYKTDQEKHKERLDARDARIEELTKQNTDLTARLHESEKQAAALSKDKQDLTDSLQTAREDLHTMTQEFQRVNKTLNDLALVYPGVADYIKGAPTRPLKQISGKVLAVDPKNNNVIINVGRKAGAKEQFEFTIHRAGEYVGSMRVFLLEGDDLAAGKIEYLKTDAQGKPMEVQVGDDVVSGIGL